MRLDHPVMTITVVILLFYGINGRRGAGIESL